MPDMQFLFFTKRECPNCEKAKTTVEYLRNQGYDVVEVDTDEVDGLTEISLRGITSIPALTLEEPIEDEDLTHQLLRAWTWGAKGFPEKEKIADYVESKIRGK